MNTAMDANCSVHDVTRLPATFQCSCLFLQALSSEVNKMESVLLNSSGAFRSAEDGEFIFTVVMSLTHPDMTKWDVPARAVAVNGRLQLCTGNLYFLWCKS